jgi:hypothetical protein
MQNSFSVDTSQNYGIIAILIVKPAKNIVTI